MKDKFNWTNQLEHMGNPDNLTKDLPAGYKEDIAWVPMDFDPYSEEERKKMAEDILKKGKKLSKIAAHANLTNDHPKPADPPARHKDEIKKCVTEDCELTDEEITKKLKKMKEDKEEAEEKKAKEEKEEKEKKEKKEKEKKALTEK